ncbi:MAG TPA: CoA transferase [Candidatus Binataceae bacterium]|jgi:crotonobetainyl-CoA:carnitine CoA-transferase CaiB-like acyl-CoA transferase|nr:CoA transferase [Candidatus Binataceae bacterium]
MDQLRHVLDGFKVLDFTQVLAGPAATRMMAEMGAEVIKVEIAPDGDTSRALPFLKDGRSAYYVQQNRGKKSLCVDLKNPVGRALVQDLIPKVDVLVENFAPGVIKRLGFGYEAVRELNPGLVMCSISTLGQSGPLADRPGYDTVGAAYAGVVDMCGYPDRAPVMPSLALGDSSTGVHAVAAITSALLGRARTGRGQYIETSLLDCYFGYHELNVQMVSLSRGAYQPRRSGAHHSMVAPAGMYKGKDSYLLIIGGLDRQWPSLCRAMGRSDLIDDPRYNSIAARAARVPEIIKIVQDWIDSLNDDGAVEAALVEHRVPFAPILTVEQAMNHPHLRQRRTVRTISDRFLGEFEVPGFPMRFSDYPELALEAPTLGEHNAAVLADYLGYPPERIADLERAGVLHRGPR